MILKMIIVIAAMILTGFGLLVCLGLFIAGLVKKQRQLWIGAMVVGMASAVIFAAVLGWTIIKGYCKTKTWVDMAQKNAKKFDESLGTAAKVTESSEETMRRVFQLTTKITLPQNTTFINGRTMETVFPPLNNYYFKMKVPAEFETVLKKDFQRIDWQFAERELTPPPDWRGQLPFWDMSEIKDTTYYERGNTTENGVIFNSVLCFDKATSIIYFHGGEGWN